MKIQLVVFFIALVFTQTNPATAQSTNFNHIPFRPEKSFQGFVDLTQDSRGYIWLATNTNGIYRYDGNEFTNFLHSDSNANSLGDNQAIRLVADSNGFIWIATTKGLDRYDPVTNSFTHFRHDPKNNSSLANDRVFAVLIDHSDNVWVGTFNGLDRFNRKTGEFKHYPHSDSDPSSISFNQVRSIYEDHEGVIWIGTGAVLNGERSEDGGLNRYNRSTDNFTRYVYDPKDPNSLETNKVRALFEDSKGNFWVGTSGDGLHVMDRNKGTFTHFHYDPNHPERLSRPALAIGPGDYITFINEDSRGRIWIGTNLAGINIFDPVSKLTNHYGAVVGNYGAPNVKKDTAAGFSDFNACQAVFTKDGTIWVATRWSIFGNYLYGINPNKNLLPFYPVNFNMSHSFYYGSDSFLWIGTDSGLVRRNLKLKTENVYLHNPKSKNRLGNMSISVIRSDREGNMWLGTFGGGLNKLNTHTNVFTKFRFDPSVNTSLNNDTIWCMSWDHNRELWIGTATGLNKFNTLTGMFTRYQIDTTNKNSGNINCLGEDQNNRMWIGTDHGLYYININSGHLTSVISERWIANIFVDHKNVVWIAADMARNNQLILYRFDSARNQFIIFQEPNSNKIISGVFDILEDDKNNLWVPTEDAVIKIDDTRNKVTKYGQSYGIHRNSINWVFDYKAKNGQLFFGYPDGFYSFYPEDLKDDPLPKLNFTGFKLNGAEVIPSAGGVLMEPIWKTEEIRLAFNQNSFSFDFLSINYLSSIIKYSFLLEKYDKTWHNNNAEQVANYFNVPPGDYIFHVKAFNENGNWVEKTIKIFISPPWWKTWWAYSLFALFLVCCIWGFINFRSRQLRKENRVLEEKVTLRTAQLNKSLEDLKSTQSQLVQSEKMASLGELTAGIAHEIQNPLNFVNNFSDVNKELIDEMRTEIANRNFEEVEDIANSIRENEEKINHHGKRADAIVKGMLQHSRSNSGKKELTDLNALADEYLRLCYHGLRAKDKTINARMVTDFDPAIGKIDVIPQDIGRVLLNLFNNAFYAVSEKKKELGENFDPVVSVKTKKINHSIQISVHDNGTGIPKNIKEKILQPFFTTKPAGSGTGLGLSLSYDIIKSHGGDLHIESSEGEGATFIISLPIV